VNKMAEINGMREVCKNATLTIAAANAHCVDEGFLDGAIHHHWRLRLPFSLPDSCSTEIVFAVSSLRYAEKAPLNRRGWTLQEYLLSQRILTFDKGQIHGGAKRVNIKFWIPVGFILL
jgi:hypothetical protein